MGGRGRVEGEVEVEGEEKEAEEIVLSTVLLNDASG
jgi:hypothetical protein